MADFSATQAAFEGFRLARERPVAILVWAGLLFLLSLVSSAVLALLAGEQMRAFADAASSPDGDITELAGLASGLAPAGLVVTLLTVAAYGVLLAAVNRAVLRPSEGGLGFVRLGPAELKQMGALLLQYLLLTGVYLVAVTIALVLVGGGQMIGGAAGAVGGVLAVVLFVGAMAFILVRFSLVSPLTFARDRVQVLQSWFETKGRFWPLLGAYVLATVMAIIVFVLGGLIMLPLVTLLGVTPPDPGSLASLFTPSALFSQAVNAVFSALGLALLGGVAASAYQQLGDPQPGADEVFA
jgi:hypothetical protein